MVIYNVTVNVDDSVHDDWLDWMRKEHIPDILRTGIFSQGKIFRIIGAEENGGKTYSIQYTCDTMELFRQYEVIYAPAFRGEAIQRYGDKFIAFRTVLESVE